jgi:hypothetical protein
MKNIHAVHPHLSRHGVDGDLAAGGTIGEIEEGSALSLGAVPGDLGRGVETCGREGQRARWVRLQASAKLMLLPPAETCPSAKIELGSSAPASLAQADWRCCRGFPQRHVWRPCR